MRFVLAAFLSVLSLGGQTTTLPAPYWQYAGSATSASLPVAIDLSNAQVITVCTWMTWPADPGWPPSLTSDALAMEDGAPPYGFSSIAGGFMVDPVSSQLSSTYLSGSFEVGFIGNIGYNQAIFARPTAGDWHHYCFVFDQTADAPNQVTPFVDGASVAYVKPTSEANTGTFSNGTLYFMSRLGNALIGVGTLANPQIYKIRLQGADVAALFAQGPQLSVVLSLPTPPASTAVPVVQIISAFLCDGTRCVTHVVRGESNSIVPNGVNPGDTLVWDGSRYLPALQQPTQ